MQAQLSFMLKSNIERAWEEAKTTSEPDLLVKIINLQNQVSFRFSLLFILMLMMKLTTPYTCLFLGLQLSTSTNMLFNNVHPVRTIFHKPDEN